MSTCWQQDVEFEEKMAADHHILIIVGTFFFHARALFLTLFSHNYYLQFSACLLQNRDSRRNTESKPSLNSSISSPTADIPTARSIRPVQQSLCVACTNIKGNAWRTSAFPSHDKRFPLVFCFKKNLPVRPPGPRICRLQLSSGNPAELRLPRASGGRAARSLSPPMRRPRGREGPGGGWTAESSRGMFGCSFVPLYHC